MLALAAGTMVALGAVAYGACRAAGLQGAAGLLATAGAGALVVHLFVLP